MNYDFVKSTHVEGRETEQQRRLALLREMMGQHPEAATKAMTDDELVQLLANGLNITTDEVLELLAALKTIMGGAGTPGEKQPQPVATKSAGDAPRRDSAGRRLAKPHGLGQRREEREEAPRRDAQGKRLRKPFAPRKDGW